MVAPRIEPLLGSLSNISQRCNPFLAPERRSHDSGSFGEMCGSRCASGYGNGLWDVGSGEPRSALGDAEVLDDRGAAATKETVAGRARLPGCGFREHWSVLGAGVYCA